MSDPDWATSGNDNAPINTSGSSGNDEHPQKKLFLGVSLAINLGLSFMVAATGAIAVGDVNNVDDSGQVFVGLYIILFSAILFTFEVLQLKPNSKLDDIFKKNFGFLYGNIGKPCYLLFIGLLCFGVSSPSWKIASGILTIFWAFLLLLLYLWKPQLFMKYEKYNPDKD